MGKGSGPGQRQQDCRPAQSRLVPGAVQTGPAAHALRQSLQRFRPGRLSRSGGQRAVHAHVKRMKTQESDASVAVVCAGLLAVCLWWWTLGGVGGVGCERG